MTYYKEVQDQDQPHGWTVVRCNLEEMARAFEDRDGGRWQLLNVLFSWATWLREPFGSGAHRITVSTVFLAIDHSFGHKRPVLWETMIFGGPLDEYQERYKSRAEAIEGHARALALARAAMRGASFK